MKSRHTGFTLIELMITVALLGILLLWAIPNVTVFIQNARMTSVSNELMADISIARQEAQRRGRPVRICASSDGLTCLTSAPDWMEGWIILAPTATTTLVVKFNKEPGGTTAVRKVTAVGTPSISFSPAGTAGTTAIVRFRDSRAGTGDLTQRDLTVTFVGRPLLEKVAG
jgi:type IV fimbrial biogenesis protein FimT